MKLDINDVLIKPVLTEKALNLRDRYNKYTFVVHPQANKKQIKEAVERIFGVKVLKVNTMNYKPKPRRDLRRRFRRVYGRTSRYKKAVVTLAKGDRIDLGV
ncbi:MAG: 50S ribosomal protein L23 [Thermotogae bacterium]|nr:50S ribosomal protein L23 [Thermotogota bacterium]